MDKTEIEDVLKNRELFYLEWTEPWPSVDSEGKEEIAAVVCRTDVNGCINMARLAAKKRGQTIEQLEIDYLLDFIVIHWAAIKGNR